MKASKDANEVLSYVGPCNYSPERVAHFVHEGEELGPMRTTPEGYYWEYRTYYDAGEDIARVKRFLVKAKLKRAGYSGLPYGKWTCADGREFLFNRSYQPIWVRSPGGMPSAANLHQWVHDIVKEEWFYDDWTTPRRCIATVRKCEGILRSWGVE